MKNLLAKKNVLLCASILLSLVTFLTLVFNLWNVAAEGLFSAGQNGFAAIGGEYEGISWSELFSSSFLATFSAIYSIILIVAAVALCAYAVFAYVKGKDMVKVSLIIAIIAVILAVIYLVIGILLVGQLEDVEPPLSKFTSAFWPLIIQAVLACGTIVAGKLMKD